MFYIYTSTLLEHVIEAYHNVTGHLPLEASPSHAPGDCFHQSYYI